MNVNAVKPTHQRVDVRYLDRFRIQTYGYDNLYPQHIKAITSASGTASLCLDRYAKFIEGDGFGNEEFSSYVLNRAGVTGDELLHNVADDVARYGGFALHINYNVLCQITEITFVPFENCRLEESDDMGNVAHIVTHPDWTGRRTRAGHKLFVDDSHISRINTFNPDPEVVTQEIIAAGGIDKYRGQILWVSIDGSWIYPTPTYDSAITDISTDEGLANIKYRNARNNFLTSCMLISRKGVPTFSEDGRMIDDGKMISDEDLLDFQGDENTSKIMNVSLENDEDEPKVVEFPSHNYDKDFSVTDSSVIERIYAQFHQELFYSIRIGKLGFSGDVMQDAYQYYAGEVTNEQRFISRVFAKVFEHWHDALLINADFSIRPLRYINAQVNQ